MKVCFHGEVILPDKTLPDFVFAIPTDASSKSVAIKTQRRTNNRRPLHSAGFHRHARTRGRRGRLHGRYHGSRSHSEPSPCATRHNQYFPDDHDGDNR